MPGSGSTSAWLWAAVVASGFYHGINPGMGWPLAVAAGLMDKSARALAAALVPLSAGHLLAMLVMLLPFAMLLALAQWQHQIQIGASLLVIAYGVLRLAHPRHPRLLARIGPAQLTLWSFVVAIAHGAGLMLVPIYLGLCQAGSIEAGNEAAATLLGTNLAVALLVSIVHSIAMILAGGGAAWLVYRYFGLQYLSRSWFNLDAVWALSLILVGTIALATGWAGRH
jgi:hypothetical protein